jgi:hypothetical protein
MDTIIGFFLGFLTWAAMVFAVPAALSVLLAVIVLVMKLLPSSPPPAQDTDRTEPPP